MKVKYESVFPFFIFTKRVLTIFVIESRRKLDPKKIENRSFFLLWFRRCRSRHVFEPLKIMILKPR